MRLVFRAMSSLANPMPTLCQGYACKSCTKKHVRLCVLAKASCKSHANKKRLNSGYSELSNKYKTLNI